MTDDTRKQPRRAWGAKHRFSIARKIWVSLSVLIFGYLGSTLLGFQRSRATEEELSVAAREVFPGASASQSALALFVEQVDLYADAVMLGEMEQVDRATERAQDVSTQLSLVTASLPSNHDLGHRAATLKEHVQAFTARAQLGYERLASPLPPDDAALEEAVRLTEEHEGIRRNLDLLRASLADELRDRLAAVSTATREQQASNLFVFVVVVACSIFLVSLILSRWILRPLASTVQLAGAMASGDLSQSLDVEQDDEIGELARAINVMAREIGRAQAGLEDQVKDRTAELRKTHEQLVVAARTAGMADVASAVLHNVGNVLNSVNVTTSQLQVKTKNSKVLNLSKIGKLIKDHEDDLDTFLTRDERGRKLPQYVLTLGEHLLAEREDTLEQLTSLTEHVKHITEIIALQQDNAKGSNVNEELDIKDLLDDAIKIVKAGSVGSDLVFTCESDGAPPVLLDRHKVLQILINLIGNAKHAVEDSATEAMHISVRVRTEEDTLFVDVADNGIGISEENLPKLFTHGFTTRDKGHGFGLHSACLAAKEMGGALTASSDGLGHGATFHLTFPDVVQVEAHV